ncbi:hypothetical protein JCM1840_005853 [Sporobolomyces johnsonii]
MSISTLVIDPIHRLDYATQLLQQSAQHDTPDGPPIAAFLWLLEVIAYLRTRDERSLDAQSAQPRSDEQGAAEEHRGKVPTGADRLAQAAQDGHGNAARLEREDVAQEDSGALDWVDWIDYMAEVYLLPPPESLYPNLAHARSSMPDWKSPFRLPASVGSAAFLLISRPSFDESTCTLLLDSCRSALACLAALPSSPTPAEDDLDATLMLMLRHDATPNFPSPLSPSAMSAVSSTLSFRRRPITFPSSSNPLPVASTFRSIAATLLEHYVSPSFRQEDRLVRALWADDDVFEEDEDADTRSIQTGIREAQASITRKDDKLRWLLGPNFQQGPNAGSSAEASSFGTTGSNSSSSTIRRPPKNHLGLAHGYALRNDASTPADSSSTIMPFSDSPLHARALSDGSIDSLAPSLHMHDSPPAGSRHQRLVSTSSSLAPLIHKVSTSSNSASSSIMHRRGVSTGTLATSSSSAPSLSFNDAGPIPSPARPTPPLQRLEDESTSHPFDSLAPAIPHSSSGLGAPLSPRRISLDSALEDYRSGRRESLPLNRNELSEQEKRELVRRSKKLEQLLGTRVGERDARHVFVGKGAVENVPPAGMISPTNTSFPIPPAPGRPSIAPCSSALSPTAASFSSSSTSYASDTRRTSYLSHSSSNASLSRSPGMQRSSSSPSRRSSSFSSAHSPDHMYFSYTSGQRRRISTFDRQDLARERKERDERRRKLEKVRRVLGERVPVGLVVPPKDPGKAEEEGVKVVAGGASMTKSRSKMGEIFKGALLGGLKGNGHGKKASGSHDEVNPPPTQPQEAFVQVEVQAQREGRRRETSAPEQGVRALAGGAHGVDALAKARKLESLFGDLPPQSLYLSPTASARTYIHSPPSSPTQLAPAPPRPRHQRSYSDLGASFVPLSSITTPSASAAPGAEQDLDLRRTKTASTVESYRRSIASLQYVLERDPGALDEVARVYQGEGEDETDGETDEQYMDAEEGGEPAPTSLTHLDIPSLAPPLARSLSASSSAAAAAHLASVRKAQKLSSFFGTTRGEVWHRLLDDIALAIEEDEGLDEDERRECLVGVERLRVGAARV